MTETPMLDDITTADTQDIGERVKQLNEGDTVKATNNHIDHYVIGTVIQKRDQYNGKEYYEAIIEDPEGTQYEIHANWRDIMPDADDQKTPYTGLTEDPFDTAPPLTDLQII